MKKQERLRFKKLLDYYHETSRICFTSKEIGMCTNDLRYLAYKGVIEIIPYTNGDPNCRVTLTNKAFSYFSDKRNERFRFWAPILLSNVIAVAALLVSILAYIKQ